MNIFVSYISYMDTYGIWMYSHCVVYMRMLYKDVCIGCLGYFPFRTHWEAHLGRKAAQTNFVTWVSLLKRCQTLLPQCHKLKLWRDAAQIWPCFPVYVVGSPWLPHTILQSQTSYTTFYTQVLTLSWNIMKFRNISKRHLPSGND